MDKISGLLDKIETHADKLGMAVGAYGELGRFAGEWKSYGVNNPIEAAVTIFKALVSDPHLPNMSHVVQSLFHETGTFTPAVIAAVTGWIIKEAGSGIIPDAGKLGNALMKAGVGAAEAATTVQLLVWSGAGHSPSYSGGGMQTAAHYGSPGDQTIYPQKSFNVGGPGAPHSTSASGYRSTILNEPVVA